MNYLALIGDVRMSRDVAERGELQEHLSAVLADLNREHSAALASPFTITLGDEFQALLVTAKPLWEMLATIQVRLYPVQVRFGVGLGAIETAINRKAALGMDGPAFYRARDAVSALKKAGGLFRVDGLPRPELINHSLNLISELQDQWQYNRFRIYCAYLGNEPVRSIAESVGISRTAVYKNINEGMLKSIRGIHAAISTQLEDYLR